MNELSNFLRKCKSSGIYLNDYEAKFLKHIFESNFNSSYLELADKNNSYLLLKEFFDKSTIRYCNNKNNFLLEKISKEFSNQVIDYIASDLREHSVGRNLHTAKKKVVTI